MTHNIYDTNKHILEVFFVIFTKLIFTYKTCLKYF
jgi:hypothetical protein